MSYVDPRGFLKGLEFRHFLDTPEEWHAFVEGEVTQLAEASGEPHEAPEVPAHDPRDHDLGLRHRRDGRRGGEARRL